MKDFSEYLQDAKDARIAQRRIDRAKKARDSQKDKFVRALKTSQRNDSSLYNKHEFLDVSCFRLIDESSDEEYIAAHVDIDAQNFRASTRFSDSCDFESMI